MFESLLAQSARSYFVVLVSVLMLTACGDDTTPPVISLNGDNPVSIALGTIYTDAGAGATDNLDGIVDVTTSGTVDYLILGEYVITYHAIDAAGNVSTATRTVNVVDDTTPPVISVNGDNPVSIALGAVYSDAGASASDDRDGPVTVTLSGTVDYQTVGEYTIAYRAVDAAGNISTAIRVVNVTLTPDMLPPIIEINGSNPVSIALGAVYSDAGASASDNRDGAVTVTLSGTVDIQTVGEYTITYRAVDAAGNVSTVTRIVNVMDITRPVINLNGDNPVFIFQGDVYSDAGATATDKEDGSVVVSRSGTVDNQTVGEYTITYYAIDVAGNVSTVIRTVKVIADTVAPVITRNGSNPVAISLNTVYIDAGASASDNRDGAVTVTLSGTVDNQTVGEYTITYRAIDTAGNVSTAIRTVNVLDNTSPVIMIIGANPVTISLGKPYSDAGVNASDNWDNSLNVKTSGTVNTNAEGEYIITYSVTDSAGNFTTATRTVNVISTAGDNAFITRWKTDNRGASSDNQIQIRTSGGGYNYVVDWGDGQIDFEVTGDIRHTYDGPGTYTVSISGDFPQIIFGFGYGPNSYDAEKILSIEQWGNIKWRSMKRAFSYCKNLELNASDVPDLAQVSDMSEMFRSNNKLNQDLSRWDVSKVTNMAYLFQSARIFNQPLDSWDVSQVTDMKSMFRGASDFNQDLSAWDVSAVTDMGNMFSYTSAFNQNLGAWGAKVGSVINMAEMFIYARAFNQDLSAWNVASVTKMRSMFRNTSVFNQDLSAWGEKVASVTDMAHMFRDALAFNQSLNGWDVSSVTNMESMFENAKVFDQDLSSWNVSSVTNMESMFSNALVLNRPLNSWDVSAVTTMESMFSNARVFNQSLNNWEVSKVSNMDRMFSGASAFNQNLNDWNVSAVTSMAYMFGFTNVFNQSLDGWSLKLTSVINMAGMFMNARAFNQPLNSWKVNSVSNMGAMFNGARVFNQPLNNWKVGSVTNMAGMFSGASVFNQPLNSWNVSLVTNMGGMFRNATAFNQDLSSWNVAAVTNMAGMFNNALAFNQPLNSWEVSQVVNMSDMFKDAKVFNQPLNSWKVFAVTDMSSMFREARVFNQDLISWGLKVAAVTDMSYMFKNADAFNKPLYNWVVSSVTDMRMMFWGANKFNQDLSSWQVDSVTNMSYMFNSAYVFNQDLSNWNVSAVTDMSSMFANAVVFDQDLSSWNISAVKNMYYMFRGISLSTANYDALLTGWSARSLQSDVPFHAGNSRYSSAVESNRDTLKAFGWSVTDGGMVP